MNSTDASATYRAPDPAQWDAWTDAERQAFMAPIREGTAPAPDRCTCVSWCGEASEAGCPDCVLRDIYEPCPVVGFGCGFGGNTSRCDCCTDAEWTAAGGR